MKKTDTALTSRLLAHPAARWAARQVSDWIDLQWSIMLEQLTQVAPRARGKLLDVGCGDKPYESIFRPFVTSYVGVEHESSFAATNAGSAASKPDVVYDGKRLPFADRSFDTVLNIQVLEHTPEPGHLLREMARVLHDDGLLILSAPFSFRLHEEPNDFFRYTPHGLRVMCEAAGLEIVETLAQGSLGSVVGHKVNSYLAFQVAGIQGLAQAMGKLGHEATSTTQTRYWTFPFVLPTMGLISAGARVFDRSFHDATEALSYLILARHKKRSPAS